MSLLGFDIDLHLPYYSPLLTGTRLCNRLRKKWPAAIVAANLHQDTNTRKVRVPRLTNIQISDPNGYEVSALVDMSTTGNTSRELQSRIETITSVLGAYSIKVEKIDPAHSRITISFQRPSFRRSLPTTTQSPQEDLDLEQFPIHLDPTDDAPTIFLTTSLLIGGASESGKSNLTWYILSQLNTYGIPYRLHVIDPAGGVELTDLEHSPLTRQYVDRAAEIPAIVASFRSSMDARLSKMKKRNQRRHFPTLSEPLEILIIDELLLCKAQLQGGDATSPLGEVLATGRKALHIVLGCSQLGEKLVIGQIRDLFPQRICLRTRSQDITDAVLGTNATVDGANCHRITRRGEGYVFTDTSGVFEKFQAPLVRETASIARGGTTAPEFPTPRNRRTARRRNGMTFLYQFFDRHFNTPNSDRPCYVGITHNPRQRFKEHEREWPIAIWGSIIHSRTTVQAFPNWDEAKAQETALIEYYSPKYNIQERIAH